MLVKELIEILKELPQDHQVIMSKDGEGNNFSPLAEAAGPYMYEPESTWSGEIVDKEEIEDSEYKENAVVFWPTS